ncbi:TIR domain-containing anti-phage reverse transcriptase [Vitreimonas flagellata]|uniref:TIR domain-containing anti-phage reverse transcriptase n=1 Tax=Vitreimonas flagellata TaxID=2560861 RepID=UPI0010756147|nr:TIR domain-containing anti-phage reverse transcriptase [Vitreimonas flagellata]
MPLTSIEDAEGLRLPDGRLVLSARDAAIYFGVSFGKLTHALYRADDEQRYRAFEIPKRTGGMRQIYAPHGIIRECQEKLAPVLQEFYAAHPAAHGFIKERSILSNAKLHTGQRYVLNVDLEDFFPSINFGRVRGLFMAAPFKLGPAAASVFAQLCTHRNGLPQGAPTSPPLSNFISAQLDRALSRLARENGVRYSRYADDITFSTNQGAFPPAIAVTSRGEDGGEGVRTGEALERAVIASGFAINHRKVRLQKRDQRQSVTGLNVNEKANVARKRIRRIRAMLHAWQKHGLEAAAAEHYLRHRGMLQLPQNFDRAYRNVVYGQLAFVKMVRGADDPVFLNLCAKVLEIDPNPSRFIRQMVFGADDYDVFISHASEDKHEIARPIFEACAKLGLKAFLDEAHIGWGQSFTQKINTALGSARTVLAVVSSTSVSKEWPIVEVNTALALEVSGQKKVVPLIVGKPDLSKLPLIRGKDAMVWNGDSAAVAKRLKAAVSGDAPRRPVITPSRTALPPVSAAPASATAPLRQAPVGTGPWAPPPPRKRKLSFFELLFGRRKR